jgi:chemotaxis protein CheZ
MNQENIENILGDKASYERAEVVKIINDVLEKVKVDDRNSAHGSNSEIVAELTNLKSVIEETKDEVARLGATDINSTHIPTATDELDAVVGATEVATGTIMDACEAIQ